MQAACALPDRDPSLLAKLNSSWHKPTLIAYTVFVLGHWSEHFLQAFQIYVLGWKVPDARGLLGYFYPWLVKSEAMHYFYAVAMLSAFWFFRTGFKDRSYRWWMIAFWIQFWHHIEHLLLQLQALAGQNLFGAPVPMSIAQLWIPRVELHLFYNTVVTIPMVLAMYYHMFPASEEEAQHHCGCAWEPRAGLARA